ncbi:hypothetical protein CLAIMM_07518 [Cladophialophora immunda]|nr:hypothetical protein CLAIMM_07518 [Cladophialophora immunda]
MDTSRVKCDFQESHQAALQQEDAMDACLVASTFFCLAFGAKTGVAKACQCLEKPNPLCLLLVLTYLRIQISALWTFNVLVS